MLEDLEQGDGDVKYTRYAVTNPRDNGVSFLPIVDQWPKEALRASG